MAMVRGTAYNDAYVEPTTDYFNNVLVGVCLLRVNAGVAERRPQRWERPTKRPDGKLLVVAR